ncbi:MAG: sucrase ferredoxin [Calothrix sp. MO_192.B10]|nr:sucrase ferredoxin [Calothrix sp. MO_192.B10]
MSTFFCSDNSRKLGEEIIGTASNYETYILIECPPPWHYQAFNSRWVPDNLQVLVREIKSQKLPISFLLIANDLSHKKDETTLLIYQKKPGISNGYRQQEFRLENIEQVATTIRKWLWRRHSDCELETPKKRDILVCTHGSHDKCCARYGNPFYFHTQAAISDLGLENIRLWRSSHFGGHRFAPTMIDFPEGRYYGNLSLESCKSILTRTGDIQCLRPVYRGWSTLPQPVQVLERELLLKYGWKWFNNKVAANIIERSADDSTVQVELIVEEPYGYVYNYLAKIVKDEAKAVTVKPSCSATQESTLVKYTVDNLLLKSQSAINYTA